MYSFICQDTVPQPGNSEETFWVLGWRSHLLLVYQQSNHAKV